MCFFATRFKKSISSWFQIFLCSPLFGEDVQFDEYFSDGLVQPPTRYQKDLSHFTILKVATRCIKPRKFPQNLASICNTSASPWGYWMISGEERWELQNSALPMVADLLCNTQRWFHGKNHTFGNMWWQHLGSFPAIFPVWSLSSYLKRTTTQSCRLSPVPVSTTRKDTTKVKHHSSRTPAELQSMSSNMHMQG